jgi:hypothetical protein
MKKIKIMLLSIAVLAVVGGALAFKAKYTETFCFTNTTLFNQVPTCTTDSNIPLACGAQLLNAQTTAEANADVIGCTAPIDPVVGCAVGCGNLQFIRHDD